MYERVIRIRGLSHLKWLLPYTYRLEKKQTNPTMILYTVNIIPNEEMIERDAWNGAGRIQRNVFMESVIDGSRLILPFQASISN